MSTVNYDLRNEIEAFWSERAATFDLSVGHEIFSDAERSAWHRLIEKHLGEGEGRSALDLASGTGVVAQLMDELGFKVTGLDWSEAMLDRARAKAMAQARPIDFYLGDAERLADPDNSYDVAITRHLVWTLVNPVAAFMEWRRVLKPGGILLVVDGDFVTTSRIERLLMQLDQLGRNWGLLSSAQLHLPPRLAKAHRSILSRVHFSRGARAEAVADLLKQAGFAEIQIDTDLATIHRAQARRLGLFKGWARAAQHRYAIRAVAPA